MNDMPNVILITFDSLSAKDMSLYGYARRTTPSIDSFAGGSYVFENMHANANATVPGLASVITGRYPLKHRFRMLGSLVANRNSTQDLAGVLRMRGYRTAGIVGTRAGYLWIDSLGKPGLGWMSRVVAGRFWDRSTPGVSLSLDATFRKTVEIMDSAREPFFLWMHIYPPHEPYLPSRPFRGTFVKEKDFHVTGIQRPYYNRFYPEACQPAVDMLRGRYNEHILEIDNQFGGFLESIETRGIFERSMIIVTSDHGEMFERGYQGHKGPLLYNPLLHIPLIVRLPNGRPGRRVTASAEQVDIAPTILDLLGCEIPSHMHGESLAGAMVGGGGSAKPKFSVSTAYRSAHGGSYGNGGSYGRSMAVVAKGHKLILTVPSGACELYDLARDPGESANIAAHEPDLGRELKEMIFEGFANDDAALHCLLPEAS